MTISEIAASFRDAGLLHYHNGRMTIEDRAGLERSACECYDVVRAYFGTILGTPRG